MMRIDERRKRFPPGRLPEISSIAMLALSLCLLLVTGGQTRSVASHSLRAFKSGRGRESGRLTKLDAVGGRSDNRRFSDRSGGTGSFLDTAKNFSLPKRGAHSGWREPRQIGAKSFQEYQFQTAFAVG